MTWNEYALLSLLPALINLGILCDVVFSFPRSRTTDLFSFFVIALILWQVEDTMLRLVVSKEQAWFWDKLFCAGWLALGPLLFHFVASYTGIKWLYSRVVLTAVYLPIAFFYLAHISSEQSMQFIKDPAWGWINVVRPGTFEALQRWWISVLIIAALIVLFIHTARIKTNREQKMQSLLIAVGMLVPALQGIVTQVIFPLVIHRKEIPVTSTSLTVFSFATIIALARFKLFNVLEALQSDLVLDHLTSIVFIFSPAQKLLYVNAHAAKIFNLERQNTGSYRMADIFGGDNSFYKRFVVESFNKVMDGATMKNYATRFIAGKEPIDVILFSRLISNNKMLKAVLVVASDVTEQLAIRMALEIEKERRQKQITEAVINAQEKERQKIGAELHDNVNQILASSLLYLSVVKKETTLPHPFVQETHSLIHNAIAEIRYLSHSIIPPSLDHETLEEVLTTLFETTKRSGILIISPDIKIEDASVSSDLKLTIYRIVQEQLNNIIKYAEAKTVYIKVLQGKATVYLSIKDDGVGFDSSQRSKGVGLMNIRTRAALYNGRVTIVSEPGKGCELNVIFELPVVAVAV